MKRNKTIRIHKEFTKECYYRHFILKNNIPFHFSGLLVVYIPAVSFLILILLSEVCVIITTSFVVHFKTHKHTNALFTGRAEFQLVTQLFHFEEFASEIVFASYLKDFDF